MKKHAYLIMAHNDWDLLNNLLKCIADERNDIFLHIDKKAVIDSSTIQSMQKTNCILIPRRKVSWGGFSSIAAELDLMTIAAEKGCYEYYHLLSGQDLPLKSQDYIHDFFLQHSGSNFIRFDPEAEKNKVYEKRIQQYHFLQDATGRTPGLLFSLLRKIERISLKTQKVLGVNRLAKCSTKLYKGANWFSITHEMVEYVIQHREYIEKMFRFSSCADEIFLQTLAMQSPYRDTIVNDCLREIDWRRGSPYTYHIDDEEMLINSPKLFARKFSTNVDKAIIERMVERLNH